MLEGKQRLVREKDIRSNIVRCDKSYSINYYITLGCGKNIENAAMERWFERRLGFKAGKNRKKKLFKNKK